MKDEEGTFRDCLKDGLRLSCLEIVTFSRAIIFIHQDKSIIFTPVFTIVPVQVL